MLVTSLGAVVDHDVRRAHLLVAEPPVAGPAEEVARQVAEADDVLGVEVAAPDDVGAGLDVGLGAGLARVVGDRSGKTRASAGVAALAHVDVGGLDLVGHDRFAELGRGLREVDAVAQRLPPVVTLEVEGAVLARRERGTPLGGPRGCAGRSGVPTRRGPDLGAGVGHAEPDDLAVRAVAVTGHAHPRRGDHHRDPPGVHRAADQRAPGRDAVGERRRGDRPPAGTPVVDRPGRRGALHGGGQEGTEGDAGDQGEGSSEDRHGPTLHRQPRSHHIGAPRAARAGQSRARSSRCTTSRSYAAPSSRRRVAEVLPTSRGISSASKLTRPRATTRPCGSTRSTASPATKGRGPRSPRRPAAMRGARSPPGRHRRRAGARPRVRGVPEPQLPGGPASPGRAGTPSRPAPRPAPRPPDRRR